MNSSPCLSRVAAFCLMAAATGSTFLQAAEPVVIAPADFPRPAHPQIGVNLEAVVDYARSMTFVDTIKAARKFGSASAPWDEAAAVDEHGWPTGDAGVVVMADTPVPAGDYAFSCMGRCVLKLVNTNGSVKGLSYDAKTNTTTATVAVNEGSKNLFLAIEKTSGGVKNMRLLRPGYPLDAKEVFTKEFLAAVAPFSTLRLMDFTHTNNNEVVEWKDRTTPESPLQSSDRGVAWEYGIELANQAKKDIWINVPDKAGDDYVKQLAMLLKEKLDKDRAVYVEYSNEVWNGGFKQAGRNADAAKAEVAAGDNKLNDGGKDENQSYWAWKRVSKKILGISAIFKDVFGAEELNKRFRPILASQAANSFMARMQVEYIEKNYGPPAQFIYGIAAAPYISPEPKQLPKDHATVADLIKATDVNGYVKDWMTQYLVLARYYRLHHTCYEGGLGVDGEDNLDAKIAMNRDPGVTKIMTDYFNLWYGQGGEEFMYYNLAGTYNKYGCWGLTDDIRVTTPKQLAVAGFAKGPVPAVNEAVNGGFAAPGTALAWKYDWHEGGGVEGSKDGGKNLAFLKDGHTFDFLFLVQEAGTYQVTLREAGDADAAVEVLFSGTSAGTIKGVKTQDGQAWANTQPLTVTLPKGQVVLRLKVTHEGLNVRSVALAKK